MYHLFAFHGSCWTNPLSFAPRDRSLVQKLWERLQKKNYIWPFSCRLLGMHVPFTAIPVHVSVRTYFGSPHPPLG
jgi:hypothetical protein